jgi:serine protease
MEGPQPVVEYYNVFLNHFFLTLNTDEMRDIDNGAAGPGWVRTGLGFLACDPPESGFVCFGAQDMTVRRFYGTPGLGPNSHFYTGDAAEASSLAKPGTGWTFEEDAFSTHAPRADGTCDIGTPVRRFYNNRFMFNDSNHRYAWDAAEIEHMRASNWIDEGVRFCVDGIVDQRR